MCKSDKIAFFVTLVSLCFLSQSILFIASSVQWYPLSCQDLPDSRSLTCLVVGSVLCVFAMPSGRGVISCILMYLGFPLLVLSFC